MKKFCIKHDRNCSIAVLVMVAVVSIGIVYGLLTYVYAGAFG